MRRLKCSRAIDENLTHEPDRKSHGVDGMRIWKMRAGISIDARLVRRARLGAMVVYRSSPHNHVWRTKTVLLTEDGIGTSEIVREVSVSNFTLDSL